MREYTQFSTKWLGRVYKAFRKERNLRESEEAFEQFAKAVIRRAPEDRKAETVFHLDLEQHYRYQKCCHLFLEPGVAEFIVNSISDDLPTLLDITTDFKSLPNQAYEITTRGNGVCFFHFDRREYPRSIGLIIEPALVFKTQTKSILPYKGFWWRHYACDGEWMYLHSKSSNPINAESYENMDFFKLVCGLSIYLEAFPETLTESDGIGTIKHFSRYKGTLSIVKPSQVARQENRNSSRPHFRRGHFRHLKSSRFTKARNTIVFVNGCFVKGKAYDVNSLEAADRLAG